jgi:hypothetical protein
MRCALLTLVGLLTVAAPLAGQMRPGHVYAISYYQTLPGKGGAYSKSLGEVVLPVLEELVKRKTIVSYVALEQVTGAGEFSHVFIFEFSDWTAFGALPAKRNEAAQAVLHKSWDEAVAGFIELRRYLRSETYVPAGP